MDDDLGKAILYVNGLPLDWSGVDVKDGDISFCAYAETLYECLGEEQVLEFVKYIKARLGVTEH